MKKTLLLLTIFLSIICNAQKIDYVENLSYGETKNRSITRNFASNMAIQNYTAEDGKTYSIGSVIELLSPSISARWSKITEFNFVVYGKFNRLTWNRDLWQFVPSHAQGLRFVIDEIYFSKPTVAGENYVYFVVTPHESNDIAYEFEVISTASVYRVDDAVRLGEVTLVSNPSIIGNTTTNVNQNNGSNEVIIQEETNTKVTTNDTESKLNEVESKLNKTVDAVDKSTTVLETLGNIF